MLISFRKPEPLSLELAFDRHLLPHHRVNCLFPNEAKIKKIMIHLLTIAAKHGKFLCG